MTSKADTQAPLVSHLTPKFLSFVKTTRSGVTLLQAVTSSSASGDRPALRCPRQQNKTRPRQAGQIQDTVSSSTRPRAPVLGCGNDTTPGGGEQRRALPAEQKGLCLRRSLPMTVVHLMERRARAHGRWGGHAHGLAVPRPSSRPGPVKADIAAQPPLPGAGAGACTRHPGRGPLAGEPTREPRKRPHEPLRRRAPGTATSHSRRRVRALRCFPPRRDAGGGASPTRKRAQTARGRGEGGQGEQRGGGGGTRRSAATTARSAALSALPKPPPPSTSGTPELGPRVPARRSGGQRRGLGRPAGARVAARSLPRPGCPTPRGRVPGSGPAGGRPGLPRFLARFRPRHVRARSSPRLLGAPTRRLRRRPGPPSRTCRRPRP